MSVPSTVRSSRMSTEAWAAERTGRMPLDSRVAAAVKCDELGGVRIGGGEYVEVASHMLEDGDVVDRLSIRGEDGRRRCSH